MDSSHSEGGTGFAEHLINVACVNIQSSMKAAPREEGDRKKGSRKHENLKTERNNITER